MLEEDEKRCFENSLINANAEYMNKEYERASIYLENAMRSLKELVKMKKEKEEYEKARLIFKELDSRTQKRIMAAMKSRCKHAED